MRMIGHLENESRARTFSDYLYAQGVDNEIEPDRSGAWLLWVRDEEQIGGATALLDRFRENPTDPKYERARNAANEKRALEAKQDEVARKRFFDRRKLFPATIYGVGLLTAALVAISVAVGIFSKGAFKEHDLEQRVVQPLSITEYEHDDGSAKRQSDLSEIRHGEIWRLITPIFIHFGPLHLLFNMLWLLDLGTMVERRQSARVLAALVLFIAATSNLAQHLMNGPSFGGMSGVVYGLIGYIWIRGKFDPLSGLFLHRTTVTMALVWFFLCLVEVIPHVANTAHATGLGIGVAWGYISAMAAKRNLRG